MLPMSELPEDLPPGVRDQARVYDNGEVAWPLSVAKAAIQALADCGATILGLDIRTHDESGGFMEYPWSAASHDVVTGPHAVEDARSEAVAELERWVAWSASNPPNGDVFVLITWWPYIDWEKKQEEVCRRYGTDRVPAPPRLKLGVAQNVLGGAGPLNGLRHPGTATTSGWYLWRGDEPGTSDDFFQPTHGAHLLSRCPEAIPFLGLPPGWRWRLAAEGDDAWQDPTLLDVTG
jgi:hypothetical protein